MMHSSSFSSGLEPNEVRLIRQASRPNRELLNIEYSVDIAVIGGGMAGTCAAIAAARQGLRVCLVQDRPVLGGNASSEVRLWMLGATSHMGNNNRWARESGIIGEIMLENLKRNREGNPIVLDTILLEKVRQEKNITLLLNTAVFDLNKKTSDQIDSVEAFCSQNSTRYSIGASYFMDCSGDGIVGFLAGAAFRMGAEKTEEFGEKLAPTEDYGSLLGHSLYFYSKNTGKPVNFQKPNFAQADIEQIRMHRSFALGDQGCKFWWVEYGGRTDTIHQTERIKWELWKVVYSIWDYIKNSGEFPESETHTLEWVGTIPGKRESRRFEGYTMLKQQDVVEQRLHPDAVAFGGWSLDLHPADGVYASRSGCDQWHSKGIYQIPLGATLSRDVQNLAFGGRIISASHVAFGSTRVMATCGYLAQATAVALSFALKNNLHLPNVLDPENIARIQCRLQRMGQHIPHVPFRDSADLAEQAKLSTSSALAFCGFEDNGPGESLDTPVGMLIPIQGTQLPAFSIRVSAKEATDLHVQLRISQKPENFTPDQILQERIYPLKEGSQEVDIDFDCELSGDRYVFICFLENPLLSLANSEHRLTGVLSLYNGTNKAVSNNGFQNPEEDIGVDSFEFWCPRRRPDGRNLAIRSQSPLFVFGASQLRTGFERPTTVPNAWVADLTDPEPTFTLEWDSCQPIRKIVVALDSDFDHSMESVLMEHPESVVPFCVRNLELIDDRGQVIASVSDNYQAHIIFTFSEAIETRLLTLRVSHPSANIPAAIFAVHCYESEDV